ncbi:peroxiredoxin [[Flexibacter] sp. ATCC 35103]|uniref:peroxiredoxin family protein n=1 Tax=[Flexibacter] sp. ATCC 35103 TaxID=1937528 RepID=UPI0013F59AD6|nr:redoxin domain-containing protein [[Flexibacter] sp. ATCC 35103]
MKKLFIATMTIFGIVSLQAQTVKMSLPKFAGKEYHYSLIQGDKKDTIAKGILNTTGNITLTLPASQKSFKGVAQFTINQDVSIDLIMNNENFTISSNEAQPTIENTKFTGSIENNFLRESLQQKKISEKMELIKASLQLYDKDDVLYPVFDKEKIQLTQEFMTQQAEVKNSLLYAARMREMLNFLGGIGNKPDMTQEDLIKEYSPFVRNNLDIETLYTSSLWSPVIENWLNMQLFGVKNDEVLLEDTKAIFSRIKSNTVYTAFAEKIVGLFSKNGKDDLVNVIGQYVSQSGRVEKPGNNLLSAMNNLDNGAMAPALKTGRSEKIIKSKTLLLFFESGCNSCENEIHQLLGNYQILQQKGYEVISIAADLTVNAGDGHNHEFPWKEQLLDFKGFKGVNFENYGVIGTPTFFVIDEKGKITGRYARLIDTGIL